MPDEASVALPPPSPSAATASREAQLQSVLRALERRFGPWVVYRLKDARQTVADRWAGPAIPTDAPVGVRPSPAISTGALSLDLATGLGGFPRGRIVELFGPASSGKSILAFHLLANAQRQHGFVTFVDAAHQASFEQMARCGVNLADLFLIVPETASEALDATALLVESGGLDALVLGPLADLLGTPGTTGSAAAEQLARLNAGLRDSPTVVAFLTDQPIRAAAGSFARALRHFATLRCQVTPLRPLLHPSGDVLGLRIRVDVTKNRLAPASRATELDLRRDRGIHPEADLVDLGLRRGLLVERAFGLCFGPAILGRGRARAIAALERDADLTHALHVALAAGDVPVAPLLSPPPPSPTGPLLPANHVPSLPAFPAEPPTEAETGG
jgi:recombination protein RecA